MASRPEPRVQTDLRVRVWGMANGKAFFQGAQARNISRHGALLSGIDTPLAPGDIIGVQCGEKKARFRVIWVIDAGHLQKTQAGVQLLDGQECPWTQEVITAQELPVPPDNAAVAANPGPATGAAAPAPAVQNKRRFPRLKISFSLQLRDERSVGSHMQTHATDISGRGCYVETIMPLARDTPLQITFWIGEEKVTTSGLVRASDPGVGMGIEFTGLSDADQRRLQEHLLKIEAGTPAHLGAKRNP